MIFESWPWKAELLHRADSLARRKTQKRWPVASLAKVEQDLMLAAYSIRKLMEAKKLSGSVAAQTVGAQSFPATGHGATRWNWDRLDKLFDISTPSAVTISSLDLANQLIHSYVFVLSIGEASLDGFFVSSDRDRNKRVLFVDLDAFITLLRTIGNDAPTRMLGTWNEKQQDYEVVRGSEE